MVFLRSSGFQAELEKATAKLPAGWTRKVSHTTGKIYFVNAAWIYQKPFASESAWVRLKTGEPYKMAGFPLVSLQTHPKRANMNCQCHLEESRGFSSQCNACFQSRSVVQQCYMGVCLRVPCSGWSSGKPKGTGPHFETLSGRAEAKLGKTQWDLPEPEADVARPEARVPASWESFRM